ncbi:MAG TPA: TIGR01777 family oxidoreductase [Bryobacteraceae bacterium]|nr:TIGR01777 family oxidoreductase [Bryobacteraceae bacterium]
MTIAITGASGLIGTRLRQKIEESGNTARTISRNLSDAELAEAMGSADAVVHLAGEPVAQRWTEAAKKRIYDSRVEGTQRLVRAMSVQSRRPRVLVCASAIGYYGSRGDQVLNEMSPPGADFLAQVVMEWEGAARSAEALGVRVDSMRFGMVLGHGGALARLLPIFRLGAGGRLGSGEQWMSWIHIEDAVNLILFALDFAVIKGPVNATSPHPVTNDEFTTRLATALHRPAFLPAPAFALKLVLGEMSEMLLASQRVLPAVAKSSGFNFRFPDLHSALEDLFGSGEGDGRKHRATSQGLSLLGE